MNEPTVCAIMLTRDRPELARKAVECFRAQTYEKKRLLVWNTGPHGPLLEDPEALDTSSQLHEPWIIGPVEGLTIGELRNDAAECAIDSINPEIFVHWDDDDHNHPNRIAEQVELLQTSGADVVGYNDMLFWRDSVPPRLRQEVTKMISQFPSGAFPLPPHLRLRDGEAWLYTVIPGLVPALGTSLCYWRKTWEKQKFANAPGPQGGSEYGAWLKGLNVKTVPSVQDEPRMIARIHAGNASRHAYNLEHWVKYQGTPVTWKRVPEWDERVGRILG